MTPKISIVVVTWNMRPLVERCLLAIDQFADVSYELFIIDNNSTDGTKEYLTQYKPTNQLITNFEVMFNPENVGYSSAADRGLEKMSGEYALLLNPDTKFLRPSLGKMIEVAEHLPDVGVVGFHILNPSGKTQWSISRLPSFTFQIKARLGLYRPKFNYDQPAEVEQINASVALIPKKVLDTIGLWDCGFFIWFEENDFCIRAKKAGFKIYYSPEVEVVHESQAGIRTVPFWKRQLIWEKSMFRYFRKHHGWLQAILIVVLDIPAMLLGLAIQKLKVFKSEARNPKSETNSNTKIRKV